MSNKRRGRNKRQGNKNRGKRTEEVFTPKNDVVVTEIEYSEGISVEELAKLINKSPADIIKLLFMMGKMVTINTNIDDETIELICMEFEIEATKVDAPEVVDALTLADDEAELEANLVARPAIVTIMGHVEPV